MYARALLLLGLVVLQASSSPVSIPLGSVSHDLIVKALNSLNDNSPTHRSYKRGNLISAQKLVEHPYNIYRLTFNLEQYCSEATCSQEACAIDLRQHENDVIDIVKNSIQCMYIYPQSSQNENQQQQQQQQQQIATKEIAQDIENVDQQTINDTVHLDHEVQTVVNDVSNSERPFIAVRATDKNYCAGCPYELNPTLPGLASFGEQVVQSMDDTGRSDFKHKVVSIVRVTRAVPPGSNVVRYELFLEIGVTNCPIRSSLQRSECPLLTSVPNKFCLVTFEERPWQQNSRQITRNNCTYSLDSDNELNGSYEPQITSEALATSLSEHSRESTPEVNSRTELHDQIAQEGKLPTFASSVDAFFESAEPTLSPTTGSSFQETSNPITEQPITKIVVVRDQTNEQKSTGFTDKFKEFNEFLENFDIPIKPRLPVQENHGVPVTEEIIRPIVTLNSCVHRDALITPGGEATRLARQLVGAPTPTSVDDEHIRRYAQEGLRKYWETLESTNEPYLIEILNATSQVVAGTLHKINILFGESTCSRGIVENCQLKENSDRNVALISVLSQPWLDDGHPAITVALVHNDNESKRVRREMSLGGINNVNPDDSKTAGVLQSQVLPEQNKQEITVRRRVAGAPTPTSVDDEHIRRYAQEGLRKYWETSESTNEPYLIEILNATSQVVAGTLHKINILFGESTCSRGIVENCQLKENSDRNVALISVWSQPWIDHGHPNIKVEKVHTDNESKRVRRETSLGGVNNVSPDDLKTAGILQLQFLTEQKKRETRVRRQLVGAPTSTSIDDKDIRRYAQEGLRKYSETSESTHEPYLIEILSATSQVVSGISYKIKVLFGESTCPRGKVENCQLKENSDRNVALISVWSQPWMDHGHPTIKVKEVHTDNESKRVRRETSLRGVNNVSTNDTKIRDYAEEGLRIFSKKFEGPYEHVLVEIVEASVRTVSGKLYRIVAKFGEGDCAKGTKEGCQLKLDGEMKDCLITVWTQVWLNKEPEIKVKCNETIREKRSLRGVNYSGKMLKLRNNIEHEKNFDKFISKYEKKYSSEEEKNSRFEIFKKNMKIIKNLQENEQGTGVYGVSMFADITPDEFRAKYTGLRTDLRSENEIPLPMGEIPDINLPKEFDWRHYNVVTEVKNQGQCGSCWAFAVTGNVEGLYAIKTGKLLSLSEQELVDCDKLDQGCEGGLPDNAYRAIENLGGLELESDYPYDGEDEKCQFDNSKAKVNLASGVNITTNETGMAQWLVKNGPIAIGINANAMQFYMGGVSHPFKFLCNGDNLDHGVLIVGYGVHTYPIFKKTMPFWTIKNSWGPSWGEQGYYRVYRGDGTCGVNRMASSAVLA